ncbi:MAG: T9SS type A sorting domain-containing protein [Ignavibacteria bacterium]|nr:T9SS type A sorting domain-containing protein [Ignavibacteria bacterium]
MKVLQRFLTVFFLLGLCSSFVLAQGVGAYRTTASGIWNAPATWETFNGSSWVAASSSPTTSNDSISILAGHTVTVTADVTIDSVYVNDGGSLKINSGVTVTVDSGSSLAGGRGLVLLGLNALEVSGTLVNHGNIVGATADRNVDFDPVADTAVFKNGSVYNHARDGGTPIVAKWETGSTYLITGITANYPTKKSQNFYHFTWNCPKQTRGDGQVNFYRTRVRGNITILSNGTQWGHDRDVRMCDNFPTRATLYEDTVWVDGNIEVRKAPDGQFSRLALSGGGNTAVISVVIVKGDIIVEDSCTFGRTNSKAQNRVELYGNLIVSGGGMIFSGSANIGQEKKIVFKKQGTQTLAIADGQGAFKKGATVVGPMGFEVAAGCTLDLGTTKIDTACSGIFVIDNGGAVKVSYGANSGKIACKGEQGVLDTLHNMIDGKPASHGNALAVANNVVGTGTITYAASALQNVSDPAKAITRQWTITPSAGITGGDLYISFSPFDASIDQRKFVAMKYTGSGTDWVNRGSAITARIDTTWDINDKGDTVIVSIDTLLTKRTNTLLNVTDLGGVWSVGDSSIATGTVGVESEEASTVPNTFFVKQNYPNPFNPSTNIVFGIPKASQVSLKIFNMLGQEVATILSEYKDAGTYRIPFNASRLSSGVYLYRVEAGTFVEVKRMMLIK